MKNIIFEKIQVQNLLSFGDNPTELVYQNGLTFVTGINLDENSKNGVGKTSLLIESLSFICFGGTYRDINNKGITNWTTNKTCVGHLWFSINDDRYEIIRNLTPSKLFIFKNGKDISKSIPESNKDILNILGMTKELFVNTIVMTNKDSNAFLNQDKSPKTKFIEGILSLEFFSKMFEKAKKEYNLKQEDLSKLQAKYTELTSNIESDKRYENLENDKVKRFILESLEEINSLDNLLLIDNSLKIKEENVKLSHLEHNIPVNEEKKYKIKNALTKTTTNIDAKNSEYKKLNSIKFNCPTCGSEMNKDSCNKDQIELQKNELLNCVKDLNVNKQKLETALTKLNNIINNDIGEKRTIQNKIINLEKSQIIFDNIQSKKTELLNNIENIRQRENPFTLKIKESEEKMKTYQTEEVILEATIKIFEARKFVCSTNGAKTDAIKKIIEVFNDRINFYLKRLSFPYSIVFDEFFEETLFNKNKMEISYGNLSGGETKRLDFAMLFAFRDIRKIQSNVSINVSVFDELFDSALDGSGINDIILLLKEMSTQNNEAYYIISHRYIDQMDNISDCNIIHLEKKNGLTILK